MLTASREYECIFHPAKRGDIVLDRLAIGVAYQDKANLKRWGAGRQDCRCRGTTWFVPCETIRHRDVERPRPAAVSGENSALVHSDAPR
jgi:site-specific DNA-methyltransferase (adenine-specific)